MDLLDRLLKHDSWTTRLLFQRAQSLSDDELDRDHMLGHRSVRRTFQHIIRNMEIWTDLMSGLHEPKDRSNDNSIDGMISRLESAEKDFASLAHDIARRDAWDQTWIDPTDGNEKSYGGCIAHLITHSMHHRAQLLYMFRRLGLEDLPEGDVLSWERQHVAS